MAKAAIRQLVEARMTELGIDVCTLGRRLGLNGEQSGQELFASLGNGLMSNDPGRQAIANLPYAIDVPVEVVAEAIVADLGTELSVEGSKTSGEGIASFSSHFVPHGVIQTEFTRPTQITMCGITGGPDRWLAIKLDTTKSPVSFSAQAVRALSEKLWLSPSGEKHVPFFGRALGFIINFSATKALRCNLQGDPLEVLPQCYRPGSIAVSVGGHQLSPSQLSDLLGLSE